MLLIDNSASQAFDFECCALLVLDYILVLTNKETALVWNSCACLACEPETSEYVEASIVAEDDLGFEILLAESVILNVGTPETELGVVTKEDIGHGVVLGVCACAWCGGGCFTHADTEDQELLFILDSTGSDPVGYVESLVRAIDETANIRIQVINNAFEKFGIEFNAVETERDGVFIKDLYFWMSRLCHTIILKIFRSNKNHKKKKKILKRRNYPLR